MNDKVSILERKLNRAVKARKQAENILEQKALELFHTNQKLQVLNENLEQKAVDKALELEKSERRYQRIVETAHDIIYRINSEGKIVYFNSVGTKVLGYFDEEIFDKHFWEFVPQEHRGEVIRFYLNAINTQKEQTYLEFPLMRKSGDWVWIGQSVTLVFEENALMEGTAMARNITEKRRFEEELQRSEERYRSIIENMELGLMEVDLAGMIVKPYPRFCEMVGYSFAELTGQDAIEMLLPEEYLPVLAQQNEDRKKGKAGIYEIQIKKKNGELIWVLISGAPIRDLDGSVTSTMGIHYDISKQKKLQQDLELAKQAAEDAQEAEKQFLANMSHEIRTPLNAIIGMSHLLYDTDPTEEQKEYLSVLKTSSDLLHQLISDILDLSKIRARKLEVQKKEFDLRGIIKGLEKNFQLKLEGRPIEMTAFLGQGLDNLMIGDDLLLNQILLNLLGNASKFTTEGHIHLHVNLIAIKGQEKTFEFRVTDTGIGIPEEKLDFVFQTFRQVDGDIKRKFGGTGLGLTITKQLIDLQNGKIAVESALGEGSTFIVQLTFKDTGRKIEVKKRKNYHVHDEQNATKKILVVEDNYMNRKYISTLLNKWNYTFKMAHNGKEGVEMAMEEKFDVIFMDVQMPVMDGYEATIAIRNQTNPNQNTAIIALTASALVSEKNKTFDVGMTDYISKPFKPDTLVEKLRFLHEHPMKLIAPSKEVLFEFNETLDVAYLNEIYEGDLEYAADMFETFLEVTLAEIYSIEPLIEKEDWKAARTLSHKCKPAFSMVGLTNLFEKMEQMEKRIKTEPNKETILTDFQQIIQQLEQFLPTLKADLSKMMEAV